MKKILMSVGLVALVAFLGTVATAGEKNLQVDDSAAVVVDQQNMSIAVDGDTNTETPVSFFKKKLWKCKCFLVSDKDKSDQGVWSGTVMARTRIGAETIGANKLCEEETAAKMVNCKKCSCGKG